MLPSKRKIATYSQMSQSEAAQPNPLLLLIEFNYLPTVPFEEFPGLVSSIQLCRNKVLVQPSTPLTWCFQHGLPLSQ